jgi:hypothetical protein
MFSGDTICRAILESPLFQQPADSSLAPNCPAVQQQINEQLLQFKAAASEVWGGPNAASQLLSEYNATGTVQMHSCAAYYCSFCIGSSSGLS